jgi:hypothetical protein
MIDLSLEQLSIAREANKYQDRNYISIGKTRAKPVWSFLQTGDESQPNDARSHRISLPMRQEDRFQ